MTIPAQVIVIGAGMAGLACARMLHDAGISTLVLDKGRGIGGRLATRRADDLQYDHGTQILTAKGADFAAHLDDLTARGAAAPWQGGFVGLPGMSGLARAMAQGLRVQQNAQASALRHDAGGWQVQIGADLLRARRLVVTVPAPQLPDLLGQDHPLAQQAGAARYTPSLTLMAAVAGPAPFDCAADPDADLAWIARDSARPARPQTGINAWVAQASAAYSHAHLEMDKDALAQQMAPLLLARLGAGAGDLRYAAAHRWRYGFVAQAVGQPYLADAAAGLYLGGDWCLGPRAEDAWTSGRAIAQAILAQTNA